MEMVVNPSQTPYEERTKIGNKVVIMKTTRRNAFTLIELLVVKEGSIVRTSYENIYESFSEDLC